MKTAYEYQGNKVYIASDFGDEVAIHPQGIDNEDAQIVERCDIREWNDYIWEIQYYAGMESMS